MKTQLFRISLEGPLSLSESNITSGSHHTLDHVPGRVLLGLAASRCYRDLGDGAFDAFHSGRVRFLDALPEYKGRRCVPMPYSLHLPKRGGDGSYRNLAMTDGEQGVQFVQQRQGYLHVEDSTARVVRPQRGAVIKTAIQPGVGSRASEGGLFSMEYLSPGESFLMALEADDEVDEAIFSRLVDALTGHARIGRSRSAQFGAVKISRVDGASEPLPSSNLSMQTRVVILLTSDLALEDAETGAPRLVPRASDFGLPHGWELDLSRCFTRHRSYDRFNGHRKAFDLRRSVITRGSVLTFQGGSPLTPPQVERAQATRLTGAGLDRQEGLGRFLFAPAFLMREATRRESAQRASHDPFAPAPDGALVEFLERRRPTLSATDLERIATMTFQLQAQYKRHGNRFPRSSQWSRVRRWARTTNQIKDDNFARLVGGTSGKFSRGWDLELRGEPFNGDALGDWIVTCGKQEGRAFLSELAHQVRAMLNNTRHGGSQ